MVRPPALLTGDAVTDNGLREQRPLFYAAAPESTISPEGSSTNSQKVLPLQIVRS